MKASFLNLASTALMASLVAAAPSARQAAPTIRIQLNGLSGEDGTQFVVPADNSVFSLNTVLDVFTAQIIDADGLRFPSCLSFSDLHGTEFATEVSFTTDLTTLLLGSVGTVKVGSVRCSHQ
ncbi:hypothetical protein F5884DRAFT_786152 [Xylogone sp. PMI_703]|nr:hypothetical protein F5884DRAFT_786152 [Xylogone sp. PMI_703]